MTPPAHAAWGSLSCEDQCPQDTEGAADRKLRSSSRASFSMLVPAYRGDRRRLGTTRRRSRPDFPHPFAGSAKPKRASIRGLGASLEMRGWRRTAGGLMCSSFQEAARAVHSVRAPSLDGHGFIPDRHSRS